MSKKGKILLILFVIALLLLVCLLVISRQARESDKPVNDKQPTIINLEELENNYKAEVKLVFARFLSLVDDPNFNVEQAEKVKNDLLELRVPTKFKDLHLNFALAISQIENFLSDGNEEDKISSQKIIEKIKLEYNWLY